MSHYRDAHEISQRSQAGEASTEDLRQALVHYRALFADLLGTDPVKSETDTTSTPAAPAPRPKTTDASDTTAAPDTDVAGSRPDATSR